MAISADLEVIFKKLLRQGWRIEQTKKNHFLCFSPDGKHIVTTGGTLSDHRAISNIKSNLRRYGALLGLKATPSCAKPIRLGGKRACPVKKGWRRGR